MHELQKIDEDSIVYCDEVGIHDNIAPIYGWSEQGKRSYGDRDGRSKEKLNIVAGWNNKTLLAPFEYSGNTDGRIFLDWIINHLCPSLKEGQTVILDNASFHKAKEVKDAIEKAGCTLLFLPPYSPDLNPIEHCWANLKNRLRKIRRKFDNIQDAITHAMRKTFPG